MLIHIFFILTVLFISAAAYLKKSLNGTGAAAAFVLGIVLYISGGVTFLSALFAFFVSSSILTRFKEREKKGIEEALYDKSGVRDHVQVLANGGAALLAASIHFLYPGETSAAALFAAFAACNADTWASELGVLSKKAPVSILTFKPMNNGISGGVTLLGTTAAFAGAGFVALFYIGARFGHLAFRSLLWNSIWVLIFGFCGSLVDSILGASLQPLYKNPDTGMLTEKKHQGTVRCIRVKGLEFFSNDMVNFISSSLASGLIFLVLR